MLEVFFFFFEEAVHVSIVPWPGGGQLAQPCHVRLGISPRDKRVIP